MLTPAQLEARKGKLTASRIACLVTGDLNRIHQLWLEMTGQAEPENLDDLWHIQLGNCTESLHLDWLQRANGPIIHRGELKVHLFADWAAATLDGWSDRHQCPVEVKHVNGFEKREVTVQRYQPQVQWQMEVSGADKCLFSLIAGTKEPFPIWIERDAIYAEELFKRGEQFMAHVRDRTPPVEMQTPIAAPESPFKTYSMDGNNAWAAAAADWLGTQGYARQHDDAAKDLKDLTPADAVRCQGYGVEVVRDRAKRLRVMAHGE